MSVEKYLKPNVINQIQRLDLRAQFVVKGFLHGLHASPLHGFSVQFSEHRRYAHGDDPKNIDWRVFAKTDKYYIKKYEAETNLNGYLIMDLSHSMDYTYRQELTKFDYAICLAAALTYLMVMQQDPVGLITFNDAVRESLAPKAKRAQLSNILSVLARTRPAGRSNFAKCSQQIGSMLRQRSLLMIFSDLLMDDPADLEMLFQLSYAGHDIILFHIMDEAEVHFPFRGTFKFTDPETQSELDTDASGVRESYLHAVQEFRDDLKRRSQKAGVDYLPLDTSMQFDKALTEYLIHRRLRT
ncbi:MAG: DUF58 domain-containing protein [Pirellulaceae bacterium]